MVGLTAIVSNSRSRKRFEAFLAQRYASENLEFFMLTDPAAHNDSGPAHMNIYKRYIRSNAPKQINVPGNMKDRADRLAKNRNWSSREWRVILADMRSEIAGLLRTNFLADFLRGENI